MLLVLAGLSGLVGCQAKGPAAERSPGEIAFRSRCQTCHRRPDPNEKTGEQWRQWLAKHRSKAGLSDAETEAIVDFLSGTPQS